MDFETLRRRVKGAVLRPGDPGYAEAVAGFNLAVRREPVVVVEAANAHDVAETIRFAAEAGIRVVVQATGHGSVPVAEPFLLLRTSLLTTCEVNPAGWARVGAGVCWSTVMERAAEHGLAPLAGSAPHVGVVGYLTGGGYGPIARSHGLASDLVRSIDVVTGDGVVHRATPSEDPELFWGLRGGKGALGVITSVEIDLLPIRTVFGGSVHFAGGDAARVLRTWRDWAEQLPAEGTTSIALKQLPDIPEVPPQLAGRLTVAVRFAWTGDALEGERVFAPMRQAAPVILGDADVMPVAALGSIHQDPTTPLPGLERNALLGALPDAAVEALLAATGPGSGSPHPLVELRQLGGAIGLIGVPSAVCHRDAEYSLFVASLDVPESGALVREHLTQTFQSLEPWTIPGRLPNFQPLASASAVRDAYDHATLDRLAGLVSRHDPRGVLVEGQRVLEATATGR